MKKSTMKLIVYTILGAIVSVILYNIEISLAIGYNVIDSSFDAPGENRMTLKRTIVFLIAQLTNFVEKPVLLGGIKRHYVTKTQRFRYYSLCRLAQEM